MVPPPETVQEFSLCRTFSAWQTRLASSLLPVSSLQHPRCRTLPTLPLILQQKGQPVLARGQSAVQPHPFALQAALPTVPSRSLLPAPALQPSYLDLRATGSFAGTLPAPWQSTAQLPQPPGRHSFLSLTHCITITCSLIYLSLYCGPKTTASLHPSPQPSFRC